jgi:soluble lytic murein transglycosylase-like protein
MRNGMAAIALFAASSLLWGQQASISLQAHPEAGQPFAELDVLLNKAADSLLASASQDTSQNAGTTTADKPTVVTHDQQTEQRSRLRFDRDSRVARLPLILLRPAVEPILRSHGVPVDLAAVILVESGGSATALSPRGARGLWQLMPDTARRYGLRVDQIHDDRLDLSMATDAAARYLHDLYAQFGDWKLALAAYNTGEANVGNAIERAHSQDFDQLSNLRLLPLETRNYVLRVLATVQSIRNPSLFEGRRCAAGEATGSAVRAPYSYCFRP